MSPRRLHALAGFLSGFVANLFLSALVLAWPLRTLGLVVVVGLALLVIIRRGDQPFQSWHSLAAGFVAGYALAAALLAALDLIFPAHGLTGGWQVNMLEKPNLDDEKIISCLHAEFGLQTAQVVFLPLGADRNTVVYRVVADDGAPYFLKLRQGDFEETSVTLPKYLHDQGLAQIIAPLATQTGQLWGNLEAFKVILYPFVEGRDGYEAGVSEHHWCELGTALRRLHTVSVPPALLERIRRETYPPLWRDSVLTTLERVQTDAWDDPISAELAAFLATRRSDVLELVGHASRLAQRLRAEPPEFVVCHSDLHAGNLLIDTHGALHLVDWDNPILAPKERDLMYAGGGLMGFQRAPHEEEAFFYQGYGQTPVNPVALAYYRYERIVDDIAAYCDEILPATEGDEDRKQGLVYLKSNFLPGNTIEIAYRSDKTL